MRFLEKIGGDRVADIKWIKVAVDMFEDSKIEFLRSLPEGDAIIVIWIQMLSIAGQSNYGGYLMVADGIPYTEQFLSNKLRRQPVLLQFALETLIKLKMINIEDGPYHVTNWEKHQNIDGMEKVREQNRNRKREQRNRNKQLLLPDFAHASRDRHVTSHGKSHGDVTRGHAIEVDIDKDTNTTLQDDFERVRRAYADIHKVMDMPYSNSPLLTKLLEDGFSPELIIGIMKERHKPSVKTLKFYEGAIRDSVEQAAGRGPSTVGRQGKASKWQAYRDAFLEGDEE